MEHFHQVTGDLRAPYREVAEMIGVAISMNGGPGAVWGPRALAAFHEFADATI